jgi:hypothetical protein
MEPQTALIVALTAAVLGQLLGAVLTLFRIRKESPGELRKQELGWDGAFNGMPDGSITLLAL